GTGVIPELMPQTAAPAQKRTLAIALAALAVIAIVGVVFAMTRGKDRSAISRIDPPAPPHVTVESLPPEPPPQVAAVENDQDIKIDAPDTTPHKHVAQPQHKHVAVADKKQQPELATAKPGLSHDAVAQKFSSVKREYDQYKTKNGGRLDGEWGDLAMFVQYHLNDSTLDEVAHRIDSFRSKMHE
ncbi:MAG TPA: hypothetical protein VGC41_26650, partial [Kofleriaceae bacterium]